MIIVKINDRDFELETEAATLILAIQELTHEIRRIANGRNSFN